VFYTDYEKLSASQAGLGNSGEAAVRYLVKACCLALARSMDVIDRRCSQVKSGDRVHTIEYHVYFGLFNIIVMYVKC
jgi:hypothetical protein